MSAYIPDPSQCGNKWCASGIGNFPASGEFPELAQCSGYASMIHSQKQTGGITGRGVTPCPFGFVNRYISPNKRELIRLQNSSSLDRITAESTLFQENKPVYVPPTGNVRPLTRIGNEWKN